LVVKKRSERVRKKKKKKEGRRNREDHLSLEHKTGEISGDSGLEKGTLLQGSAKQQGKKKL